MNLLPIAIPPGIDRRGTEYQSKGRWYTQNLTRWYNGETLGPVLGFSQFTVVTTFTGKGRALTAWLDDSNNRWIGVGTESHLYAVSSGGVIFDITPSGFTTGNADETAHIGYGDGTYGSYTYGDARPDTGSYSEATVWDLDTWGQYLIGNSPEDGKIYQWTLNTGTIAAAVTNAPTACKGVVVTGQRFVMALGAGGNNRKLQWSDQDDNTVWSPSATNQAGDVDLPRGKIILGRTLIDQVIVLTDREAYIVEYIGLPFVYSPRKVGDSCGAVSKRCIATSGQLAAWWSQSGFWTYNGVVTPLDCPLWDMIQNNITSGQLTKISAFHNSKYSEFWWFYPSSSSTEIDSYVFWNYKYNHWGMGSLVRLAGTEPGTYQYPILVGNDGNLYEHENGHSYGGATPTATSGPMELGAGERVMHVLGIVPDEKTVGDVSLKFNTRLYPNASQTVTASMTPDSTGKVDVRFSARQVELVVTGAQSDDWRFGNPRLWVAQGGKR